MTPHTSQGPATPGAHSQPMHADDGAAPASMPYRFRDDKQVEAEDTTMLDLDAGEPFTGCPRTAPCSLYNQLLTDFADGEEAQHPFALPLRNKGKQRVPDESLRPGSAVPPEEQQPPIYTPQDSDVDDDADETTPSEFYAVASTVDSAFTSRAATPTQRDFLQRSIDSRIPGWLWNGMPRTPLSTAERRDFDQLILLIHDYIGHLGDDEPIDSVYGLFIELHARLHQAEVAGDPPPQMSAARETSFHDEQLVYYLAIIESRNPRFDGEREEDYDQAIMTLAKLAARLLSLEHPLYLAQEAELRKPPTPRMDAQQFAASATERRLKQQRERVAANRHIVEAGNPIWSHETEQAYRERIDWLMAKDIDEAMNPEGQDEPMHEAGGSPSPPEPKWLVVAKDEGRAAAWQRLEQQQAARAPAVDHGPQTGLAADGVKQPLTEAERQQIRDALTVLLRERGTAKPPLLGPSGTVGHGVGSGESHSMQTGSSAAAATRHTDTTGLSRDGDEDEDFDSPEVRAMLE